MTTMKQIAGDPRKALKDLENKLGSQPGELLRETEQLAPPGEEWGKHLSYRVAAAYYDDEQARTTYQAHVDGCNCCKTLLETLHPTSLEAEEFASRARRMHSGTRTGWASHAMAAGLAAAVIGAGALGVRDLVIERRIEQLQFGALKISTDADTFAAMTRDGATFAAGQPVYLLTEVQNAPSPHARQRRVGRPGQSGGAQGNQLDPGR